MKKYLIYTVNDTEPFVVETDEDLMKDFSMKLRTGKQVMFIQHRKDLLGLGKYKYNVLLNVNNIVSITTSEKV